MPVREPPPECDLVVVGAGIVGLATARELLLRHPGAELAVLEREPRIAVHQTGHSSGVIHSGVYYAAGSLKAGLCVAGAAELYDYCDARGIPTRRDGKVVVATGPQDLGRLAELERRGAANGVPGLRRLDRAELREVEPHAEGLAALHAPSTGVVDFARVAASCCEDVERAGGRVICDCGVSAVAEDDRGVEIVHARGTTRALALVACAGAWSDRLARASGGPAEPRIVPFRGAYLRLRPERSALVRGSIYPVPDPELPFLGAHLTRGIDGSVLLGPTALIAGARDAYSLDRVRLADLGETLGWPGTWRLARRFWRAGATEIAHEVSTARHVAEARRLVPQLRPEDFSPGPTGVRGQALARDGTLVDDFVVTQTARAVHVRNAPSPAATAALPLARLIADRAQELLGDRL